MWKITPGLLENNMHRTRCPNCGNHYTPDLAKRPDFMIKHGQWKARGELIQNVWPEATTIQREQLQTGICSDKCWDEYLGVPE